MCKIILRKLEALRELEAMLVLPDPAERARYCKAAKAKIAQTKPAVMAA